MKVANKIGQVCFIQLSHTTKVRCAYRGVHWRV